MIPHFNKKVFYKLWIFSREIFKIYVLYYFSVFQIFYEIFKTLKCFKNKKIN